MPARFLAIRLPRRPPGRKFPSRACPNRPAWARMRPVLGVVSASAAPASPGTRQHTWSADHGARPKPAQTGQGFDKTYDTHDLTRGGQMARVMVMVDPPLRKPDGIAVRPYPHRCPRGNRRQDPVAGTPARGAFPQAVADHRRHRRRHLANHFAAGAVGAWVASFFSEATLSWILAASFIAVALWTLVPDKLDDEESGLKKYGPFLTTLIAFFLAEMGDKTQVATVMLAARVSAFLAGGDRHHPGHADRQRTGGTDRQPGRRQAAADPDPPPGRGRLRRTWPATPPGTPRN